MARHFYRRGALDADTDSRFGAFNSEDATHLTIEDDCFVLGSVAFFLKDITGAPTAVTFCLYGEPADADADGSAAATETHKKYSYSQEVAVEIDSLDPTQGIAFANLNETFVGQHADYGFPTGILLQVDSGAATVGYSLRISVN